MEKRRRKGFCVSIATISRTTNAMKMTLYAVIRRVTQRKVMKRRRKTLGIAERVLEKETGLEV